MAGYLKLFFKSKLDAQGRNTILKKNYLMKLIDFRENYELCYDTYPKYQLIMARDFHLLFDSKLYAQYGNSTLKKKCSAKLIDFKKNYELFDIWRVRNRRSKQLTFSQNHSPGFIQSRFDYILIPITLHKFLTIGEILTRISTYHSPLLSISFKFTRWYIKHVAKEKQFLRKPVKNSKRNWRRLIY